MTDNSEADNDLATYSLELVHAELTATLESARAKIEAFVDGADNAGTLNQAADLLHLATGALKIVEVHGAAMLAEEMERTCRFLQEADEANPADQAVGALTRAVVQLPTYLERLLSGTRDVALVLLPLLNDLRAARGQPLISEGALVQLNASPLETDSQDAVAEDEQQSGFSGSIEDDAFLALAAESRPDFQSALLGWIRGSDPETHLGRLAAVSAKLESRAKTTAVVDFWAVVSGVFRAVLTAGVEASVSLKRLAGQVDRELKALAQEGEAAFRTAAPVDLQNNLLYYIARSTSDDPKIERLRERFGLTKLLPGDDQLEEAREVLSGPSVRLMRTVAEAIKQDMASVKDSLDVFVRTGKQDLGHLLPQLDMLQKIADTLGVLGLTRAQDQISQQISQLSAVVEADHDIDHDQLEGVAAELLSVEQQLDQELVRTVLPSGSQSAEDSALRSHFAQVTQAVMSECMINLAKVKESIVHLVQEPDDYRSLEQIRPQLRGIAAGLLMLNKTGVVRIIERIGEVLENGLRSDSGRLDVERVERLADAIVSVEFFMETVSAGRKDPWYMLENAARCLEAAQPGAGDLTGINLAGEPGPGLIDVELTGGSGELMPAAAEVEAGRDEATLTGRGAGSEAPPSVRQAFEERSLSDPELLEIFIDEAKGEIHNILERLPEWISHPADSESLTAIRRSFHTLKGSGRTVGAVSIGDFAWSIENLLNRLLNKTLPYSTAISGVVADASEALPELLNQLESGMAPSPVVDEIENRANQLAAGESIPEAEPEPEYDVATESAIMRMPGIDPVLIEIFTKEARGHLAEIGAFADLVAEAGGSVTEPAYRAAHTLLGSSNMAKYEPCVTLAEPLSNLLSFCHQNRISLDAAAITVVRKAVAGIRAVIDELAHNRRVDPEIHLVAELESILAVARQDAGDLDEADESIGPDDAILLGEGTAEEVVLVGEEVIADLTRQMSPQEIAALFPDDPDLAAPAEPAAEADAAEAVAAESEAESDSPGGRQSLAAEMARELSAGEAFDPEIAAVFTEEASELLEEAELAVQALRYGKDQERNIGSLRRLLHTLKGGARMAGLSLMSDVSHALESVLASIVQEGAPMSQRAVELVQRGIDELQQQRDCVDTGRPLIPPHALLDALAEFGRRPLGAVGGDLTLPMTEEPEHSGDESAGLGTTADPELAEEIEKIFTGSTDSSQAMTEDDFERWIASSGAQQQSEDGSEPQEPAAGLEVQFGIADGEESAAFVSSDDFSDTTSDPDDDLYTPASFIDMAGEEPADSQSDLLPESVVFDPVTPDNEEAEAAMSAADAGVDESADLGWTSLEAFTENAGGSVEQPGDGADAAGGAAGMNDEVPGPEQDAALDLVASSDSPETTAATPGTGLGADFAVTGITEYLQTASEQDYVELDEDWLPESEVIRAPEFSEFVNDLAPVVSAPEARSVPAAAAATTPVTTDLPAPEAADPASSEAGPSVAGMPEDDQAPAPAAGMADDRARPGDRGETARVEAQLLDQLLNASGEISIFQARLTQQLQSVDFHLGELGQTVSRLTEQLRKLEAETEAQILFRHQGDVAGESSEFDPLELDRYSTIQQLSRALSETTNDISSIKELLDGLTTEAGSLLSQQGRVTAEVQHGLMQTRMVPFQRHVSRFARVVRQAAADTGKAAELVVRGAGSELDRQVLDAMLPALEHLLRNAVVHGIERPEIRAAASKPDIGQITLTLAREGAEVSIIVEDDGAGLNLEQIGRVARERALIGEDESVDAQRAGELILLPGFTTAGRLTQSAGRGVGMDVVENEVKKLGGSMAIHSAAGAGARFQIRLPYTLAITHALIVDVGEETFALPLTTVEGITRVRREQLLELLTADDPRLDYGEISYRLQHLGMLVGSAPSALSQEDSAVALVLVRAGEHSAALLTDRLEGSREIVVKSLGPHIASVPGVTGATILGDGRVITILDAATLVRQQHPRAAASVPVAESSEHELTALVVDDSITMRRVTERFLERRGIRVFTARDGLDAISVMQDCDPDIILLDIEMPRMDGYQFASHVRNDAKFRDLPIIMITSRSGEKHRARAIEVGVNEYLSKPYQEQQLVDAISALLGREI